MIQYKTCSECMQEKPLSAFHKDKHKSSGYTSNCAECRNKKSARRRLDPVEKEKLNAQSRLYYSKNKEKIAAAHKEWVKKNPQRRKEINTRFAQKNKQARAARMRAYRLKNPDVRKMWSVNNPDKQKAIYARRRARKKDASIFLVSSNDLNKIYQQKCSYCGSSKDIQIDHVIPLARGGSHSIGNLTAACKNCNSSKKDLYIVEWKYGKRVGQKNY